MRHRLGRTASLLTYAQATDSAILFAKTAAPPKPPRTFGQGCTVKDAVDAYLTDLAKRRPSSSGVATARQQADRYILPRLGDRLVGNLKTKELSDFVKAVAATPASVRGKGKQKRVDRKDYDLTDPAVMRARFETASGAYGRRCALRSPTHGARKWTA